MVDLSGLRLRCARANRHIGELESMQECFLAENPCRIVCEPDAESQSLHLRALVDKQLPAEASVVIGDVLHNLRASLDNLACLSLVKNGRTPDFTTQFPVADDSKGLENAIRRKLAGASPRFVGFVRTMKPYRVGGDNVIFQLSRLNNIDKHRSIITTTTLHELTNVRVECENGNGGRFNLDAPRITFHGSGYACMPFVPLTPDAKVKIQHDPNPSFEVRFCETGVADGSPVIETLKRFANRCREVIDAAEF
jgi:hypothetical protein